LKHLSKLFIIFIFFKSLTGQVNSQKLDWLFVDKAEGTWGEKIIPYDSNHWLLVLDEHEGFKIRVMDFERKTKSEVIFYHYRYKDFVSVNRQDSVLLKDKLENVHVLFMKNQKGRVAFNWTDKIGMMVESKFLFSSDDYAYLTFGQLIKHKLPPGFIEFIKKV